MTFRPFLIVLSLLVALPLVVAAEVDDSYRLGTGDKIRIQIHGEETLAETTIGDTGTLTLPYVGEIRVAGRTARQVRQEVRDLLVPDYFVDPDIIVSLEGYRSFFMYGEIKKPGSYPFEPGLTVGKAIALAGGLTERASRRRIFVVRDSDPQGANIRVDESAALRPGDVVTIEPSFF